MWRLVLIFFMQCNWRSYYAQNACWNGHSNVLNTPPPPTHHGGKNRVHSMTFNYTSKKKGRRSLLRVISTHLLWDPQMVMSKCTILILEHTFEKQRVHGGYYVVGSNVFHGIKVCGLPIERGVNTYQNYILLPTQESNSHSNKTKWWEQLAQGKLFKEL